MSKTTTREYSTVRQVTGPLMVVEGVAGVAYGEIVDVILADGGSTRGHGGIPNCFIIST